MADPAPHDTTTGAPIGIVDDDPFVGNSLGELLQSDGFETRVYASGAALLADPRRSGLRCLLIDFHMPMLNGVEVVAALRREGCGVPCALMTGRYDARVTADAAAVDLVAVLEKPFSGARVIEVVRAAALKPGPGGDGFGRSPASPCRAPGPTRGSPP